MSRFAHPVLSLAEAHDWERRLFQGDEAREWNAMQQAGAAVAKAVLRDFREIGSWPASARVLVVAGKGHNAGDAFIAASILADLYPCIRYTVIMPFGERALRPLATRAWREFRTRPGLSIERADTPSGPFTLALDGLFGFQFRPPLGGDVAALLRAVNTHDILLRAAIDLPSGLGDPDAFRADFTYATGSVKAPLLEAAARETVGRLRYLDLNFFGKDATAIGNLGHILTPALLRPLRALRPVGSDKRTFGHLGVIAGSRRLPGAVLMSVRAALHAGVGLVTAFVPESLAGTYAAHVPEAMWVPWPETPDGSLALEGLHLVREAGQRATAWLMGPGLGRHAETLAMVGDALGIVDQPVILDADALQPELVRRDRGPLVVTPHAGEWQRIGSDRSPVEFTREHRAIIVMKGALTRIHAGTHTFFSPAGGPVLARGGSGDLLAGMIGGRVAQAGARLEEATCEAVLWHGLAAEALARARGQVGVTTTELLEFLPHVLRETDCG